MIVRSTGERTAELCHALLAEELGGTVEVAVVRESPFCEAVRRAFEIGCQAGRKWTLMVDADVVPRAGGVRAAIEFVEGQPEDLFVCLGMVLDKFFFNERQAGYHVYRTDLLPKALDEFTPAIANSIRPENQLMLRMCELGSRYAVFRDRVAGLHDYDQFYRDIYRKAFVHAKKHPQLVRLLLNGWLERSEEDSDFLIAFIGARAGLAFPRPVRIDIKTLPKEVTPILEALGLEEKPALEAGHFSPESVEEMISSFDPPPGFGLLQRMLGVRKDESASAKIGDIRDAVGWTRVAPWLVGAKMRNLGRRIVEWAESGQQR